MVEYSVLIGINPAFGCICFKRYKLVIGIGYEIAGLKFHVIDYGIFVYYGTVLVRFVYIEKGNL